MENVYTREELKAKLGFDYAKKVHTEVVEKHPELTSTNVWDALNGRCKDLTRIKLVMTAATSAIQKEQELQNINKQLKAPQTT